jgi:hypothetical protein
MYDYYARVEADVASEHVMRFSLDRRLGEGAVFEHHGRSYRVLSASFDALPKDGHQLGTLTVERTDALG